MLSQKTIEIVKSTAPVLEVKGQEITTAFYKLLFSNHPELLNIFNHANQSQGRQQTALANTVYAAAKYIDQLEVLVPAVKQIAHKHRSLAIKPEHYPIVGKYLLEAIKEVLGEAATDEIINAWAEAYGEIANVFISVERAMYTEAQEQEGGWIDFKEFVVADKKEESSVITSFYLKPKDGGKVASFTPGQYITIQVSIPGEKYIMNRQYSLSDAPGKDYYRISVKREAECNPKGKVSNFLHDGVNVGDTIKVSAPAGDFVLESNPHAPITLIAGGVGVTPMISMLKTLADQKAENTITFIQAARNNQMHAFLDEVNEACDKLDNATAYFGYDADSSAGHFQGYIEKSFLRQAVPSSDSICYVCGPARFMESIIRQLKEIGIQEDRIRYEFFGPAMTLNTEPVETEAKN
ncbi:NO-inducible flavohemoprotein [Falsibacillus pallidus]|uniref:Flavohemoprotein n=1 Tax=Falsibacillus pallidus TaxID=493781 RepID=A0A370GF02_9BACI|nr:NO-inducible flavohemoprotein [Falsibacillus pallidus]RDI42251.1 nitric oxide dioxygenase [Falsibacillus pallidus]